MASGLVQKTTSTKTRIIKWLVTETDTVLTQLHALHAELRQQAVGTVAKAIEVSHCVGPFESGMSVRQ
jgi:hypothetical protein